VKLVLTLSTANAKTIRLEPDHPTQFRPNSKGVNLRQVYPSPEKEIATNVDIIAIYGLDTQSPDTWIWDPKGARINWLEDPHMLPKRFPTARIFTCDWPAELFEQPGFVRKMIDERPTRTRPANCLHRVMPRWHHLGEGARDGNFPVRIRETSDTRHRLSRHALPWYIIPTRCSVG